MYLCSALTDHIVNKNSTKEGQYNGIISDRERVVKGKKGESTEINFQK
jgi:hypothetical protein